VYIPHHYHEERVEVQHQLIRRVGFASLVTQGGGGLDASHLPMMLDAIPSPLGVLRAHVARANPQWRDIASGESALAIFAGPHHYISPSWYPSKLEHGKAVPTWNYIVVHAHGRLRAIDDRQWLRAHLEDLVTREEASFAQPWKVSDAPEAYIDAMLGAIVGLEMTIERLEGKWKLSQNRPQADRAGAVAGLRSIGAGELADLVEDSAAFFDAGR
jgi:transcriptional regulator